jgi:hypothetical protein
MRGPHVAHPHSLCILRGTLRAGEATALGDQRSARRGWRALESNADFDRWQGLDRPERIAVQSALFVTARRDQRKLSGQLGLMLFQN